MSCSFGRFSSPGHFPESNRGLLHRQRNCERLSKLFRNVPLVTSLEVSPFLVLFLVLFSSFAQPGEYPCGARRAERLGRSAGLGQRRPRRHRRHLPFSLLLASTGRLAPRVVARGHPFPLHLRRLCCAPRLARRLARGLHRFARPCNFLPSQRPPPILDRDVSVPPFAHQHFVLRWRTLALPG